MLAAICRAPGPLSEDRLFLETNELPEPRAGEVLIEVAASAICRTDLQIVSGDLDAHKLPIVPGHQVVGRVVGIGPDVDVSLTDRLVGLVWLAFACGMCGHCASGRENLCEAARFTGWDQDGGFASHVVARSDFVADLTMLTSRSPAEIAPLLCAGVIGYRSLKVAGISSQYSGMRLGLFGYGASARLAIQVARYWSISVYVVTRTSAEADEALAAGAAWAGTYDQAPPVQLDAAITFAPVGDVVISALQAVDRGGVVAVNAIHLDRIPEFSYDYLWWERSLRSVANVTRADVSEFISLVAAGNIQATYEEVGIGDINTAMRRIAASDVKGSFVITEFATTSG